MSGAAGMNFAETTAYWYFRLNGFFPIVNFVQHGVAITRRPSSKGTGEKPSIGRRVNSDADVLAVRFPHVVEDVGGQSDDWDSDRFEQWGWDYRNHVVAVICQVKTGEWKKRELETAFARERLEYAIKRFGIFPDGDSFQLSSELYDQSSVSRDKITISKVLVSPCEYTPSPTSESGLELEHCCRIGVEDALQFVLARLDKYRKQKCASRMLFSSEWIQAAAYFNGKRLAILG